MAQKPSPRPVKIMGYLIVIVTFGVLGAWASFAKLDSAVFAPGTISLEGNRKVVQHFEGGIVQNIFVREADTVKEGDVLLRLNDIEARSNLEAIETRMDVARIVEARLLAERGVSDEISLPADLNPEEASTAVTFAFKDQQDLFEDRRSILKSRLDILSSRIEQTNSQIKGLELQKSASDRRVENFTEMVTRMRSGQEMGLIQTNTLSQREDELISIEASLGGLISEIAQAKNVINETEFEMLQIKQEYRERASNELEEVRAEIAELAQRHNIASDVLDRTEIRAPGSGTIQNLKVHTVGSVVRPGDILMELVPEDEELVVNARVSPLDVDNVVPGLSAEVRFTAFKTRLTPILLGKINSVSNDVITPDNPQEAPYYLARIDVEELDIPEEISGRLTAGMPADVIITTGERTVINFIVSPLLDAVRKSLIEE
ncbi:HlyD family type I secretion periplasmic adaptor subunit [Sulfitobacter pseudonitzschiae]|uniref:Membrane fusion protein (MFP) family protein n=1 Tax=Pseudosulfitobacter pseudonitzschiae TaxID=1402135 RepID=A0A9Q2NT67_9RHOB|nr:HlyD family type I secretion periplasmic adaptor subunit [Pseudosulfitobacter pseudonitzschiae]MBM2295074.1 HlyD family type I secretion periplasmic adaptor subunit [Pseudosulfitobacter pseudonitzschiae]MBM2299996.1 HlyD family type I secretion periplasmic adaptor subunit [Pseudosulfitobacter pseudonitzschiae]MBM2304912.1 HlyD family type I secretion periplasmic adaptor subunit [Pseudosulfitobacter pseudonitzschiae]MBM2314685.1 HlyD family type I secretion periplasmic adaptor subunit [Pseudo